MEVSMSLARTARLLLLAPLLATSLEAQTRQGGVFARLRRPPTSVHLDLATGVVTHGPVVRDRTAGTTADFANLDLSGFIGTDSGGGFCEWIDAGTKGFAGNQSDLMSEIAFAYCSVMRDVSFGGPGGSVRLGFYEGYALGGGAPTTTAAVLTLTGLPANSTSSSFFSGFTCHFMTVSFGSLVGFADGPIGYSWGFLDVGTDGIFAGTFPFLSCVVSCSGMVGEVDGQGMTDFVDEYCPLGTLRSTFSFGTTSGSFTSIPMEIREVTDAPATIVPYDASVTPNPDQLASGPAIVGTLHTYNLARGVPSAPGSFVVNVRPNRIPLANGVQGPPPLPLGAGGRILISGPRLTYLFGAHDGMVGSVGSVVPASFDLVCLHFAAQATVVGGGVRVSSAVEGTTGTF
jgi:hypothetical protein